MTASKPQPDDRLSAAIATVEALVSRDAAARFAAERAVANPEPDIVEALLFVLRRESRKTPRRALLAGAMTIALSFGAGIALDMASVAFFGSLLAIEVSRRLCRTRLQRAATRAIATLDDLRAVGPFLDDLYAGSRSESAQVVVPLVRSLRRIGRADAAHFTESQRTALRRATFSGNLDLAHASLDALDKIGDESDLPTLRKLATNRLRFRDRLVASAAQVCIESVEARVEAERERTTLLRPAAAPDDQSAVLLRPAHGIHTDDENKLLRPADEPPEDGD